MELKATVAPTGFDLAHPELYHYTSIAGCEGIIRSRTLWATHFKHLNDRSEITHLQEFLIASAAEAMLPIVNRLRQSNSRVLGESRASGGPKEYAGRHAKVLIDSFYQTSFTGASGTGASGPWKVVPMTVPFIASFCSHAGDHSYEKENGLLSQWRGYGERGGCCVVFDTAGLVDLILREWDEFYWIGFGIDQVIYATPDMNVSTNYASLIVEFTKLIETGMVKGLDRIQASSTSVVEFLQAATRFKHQGFREEKEVRIVAIPGGAEIAEAAAREHPDFKPKSVNFVRQFDTENRGRPYLPLFRTLDAQLPIIRIIMGPSPQIEDNLSRVRAVAGPNVPLIRSATPFIW